MSRRWKTGPRLRLSEDKVKQGILHTEVMVRQSAMDYFAGAFSTDPAVMSIGFQALKKYGAADAFEHYEWMGALPQTDESFGLALAELRGLDGYAIEFDDYRKGLEQALQSACASLLERHDEEIQALDVLDAAVYPSLRQRVRLFGLDPPAIWNELGAVLRHDRGAPIFDPRTTIVCMEPCRCSCSQSRQTGKESVGYFARIDELLARDLCGDGSRRNASGTGRSIAHPTPTGSG